MEIQQVYRNTKEAFDKYISAKGLPVKQSQFYSDVKSLGMMQQDKTILLSDLLGYVDKKFPSQSAVPSIGRENVDRQKADEELRNIRLKNDKLEAEKRKDDRRWVLRDDAEAHEAALIGLLRDALSHRVSLDTARIIQTLGISAAIEGELKQAMHAMHDTAFNELADLDEFDVQFAQSDQSAQSETPDDSDEDAA